MILHDSAKMASGRNFFHCLIVSKLIVLQARRNTSDLPLQQRIRDRRVLDGSLPLHQRNGHWIQVQQQPSFSAARIATTSWPTKNTSQTLPLPPRRGSPLWNPGLKTLFTPLDTWLSSSQHLIYPIRNYQLGTLLVCCLPMSIEKSINTSSSTARRTPRRHLPCGLGLIVRNIIKVINFRGLTIPNLWRKGLDSRMPNYHLNSFRGRRGRSWSERSVMAGTIRLKNSRED